MSMRVKLALTLNVTLFIHHRFITSIHPDLPVLFINPCHSLSLFIVLPIPDNSWLTPSGDKCTEMVGAGDRTLFARGNP